MVWKFPGIFLYFPSVFSCVALSQWQEQKPKFDLTNLESLVMPISMYVIKNRKKIRPSRKKIQSNGIFYE